MRNHMLVTCARIDTNRKVTWTDIWTRIGGCGISARFAWRNTQSNGPWKCTCLHTKNRNPTNVTNVVFPLFEETSKWWLVHDCERICFHIFVFLLFFFSGIKYTWSQFIVKSFQAQKCKLQYHRRLAGLSCFRYSTT